MSILDLMAERLPELEFKRFENGKVQKVVLMNAEATETLFNDKIYRIVIEEVDDRS